MQRGHADSSLVIECSARAIEEAQTKEKINQGHRVLYFFASKHVTLGDIDEARLKDLQPTLKNVLLTFWDQLGVDEDGGIGGGATKNFSERELKDGIIWKLKDSKATHISMFIDASDALSPSDETSLRSDFLEECNKWGMQVCFLTSYTYDSNKGSSDNEICVTKEKNKVDMEEFLRVKLSKKMLQHDESGEESTKESMKEEKDEIEDIVKKIMDRAQEM